VLYTKVVEVEERVAPEWLEFVQDPSLVPAEYGGELVEGVNGSKLRVLQPLSEWFTLFTPRALRLIPYVLPGHT
jgi:5-oxoprolinase (ATP-hydrolysing)